MYQRQRLSESALSTAVSHATGDIARGSSSPLKTAMFAASGLVLLGSSMITTPVMAQQESAAEEIMVTGSRIRRQDFEANSPITTVDSELFEETNTVGVETILNQLPQFVPAVTQFSTGNVQNEATSTVGASTVSLRGLGSNRNLVLINGRRGQPVNAALVVDTNSIPSSMIQRVEIISGGASAVYGADAIGGVVNFILKDNYEGATIETRYGLTEDGKNEEYQISGLFGADVADGRGNVMLGMEYASREELHIKDVDWRVRQLNDPGVATSDFFMQNTFFESGDPNNLPSQAAIDQVFSELPPGTIDMLGCCGRSMYINNTPDGTGTVFTGAGAFGSTAGIPGNYKFDGAWERDEYPGIAYRKRHPNGLIAENALDQWVSIPLDRYSMSANGTYDFTDNITGRMEARFSKNSNRTILGFPASALSGNAAFIPHGSEIWLDSLANRDAFEGTDADGNYVFDEALLANTPTNPAYLPGGSYGLNCPETGGCTNSDTFPLPAEVEALMASRDNPNDDVRLNRPMGYMGPRSTATDTTTFQMVVGLEGQLNNGWFWDLYGTHGQTETSVKFDGFASLNRWREVVQSPNFGVNFVGQNNEEAGGQYSGIATCTSGLPVIRTFEMSQDCQKAIETNLQNSTKMEQNTLELNLSGDAFQLPAGMMQFAVGASYRDAIYSFHTDNLTTAESFVETALGLYPTSNTVGEFDTQEIYGELLVPVVADLPGIQRLDLELGARLSDYSTVGEVETFKALVDWTINDWARLRGGFQKANRAPNIGELYLSPTYARSLGGTLYGDQCSQDSEGPFSTNPTFNANGASGAGFAMDLCRAMMGNTGADQYYSFDPTEQNGQLGLARDEGNPDIQSESADTWTAGLVIQSPSDDFFWGGFSGSLDWYEIEITDMIALEANDAVVERCMSPAFNPTGDPNSTACNSIGRDPLTGAVQFIGRAYTNQGRALTSGVDIQLDWSGQFDFGGIGINVLANYNIENITQEGPGIDEIDWAGTRGCSLGLQCMGYDYQVFTTLSWFNGPWNASLRWRYYPTIDSGAKAQQPDTRSKGVHSDYSYFALTGGYQVNDALNLSVGVENLFDKLPPYQGGEDWRVAENPDDYNRSPTRAGGGVYDPIGRRLFVSARMRF